MERREAQGQRENKTEMSHCRLQGLCTYRFGAASHRRRANMQADIGVKFRK